MANGDLIGLLRNCYHWIAKKLEIEHCLRFDKDKWWEWFREWFTGKDIIIYPKTIISFSIITIYNYFDTFLVTFFRFTSAFVRLFFIRLIKNTTLSFLSRDLVIFVSICVWSIFQYFLLSYFCKVLISHFFIERWF